MSKQVKHRGWECTRVWESKGSNHGSDSAHWEGEGLTQPYDQAPGATMRGALWTMFPNHTDWYAMMTYGVASCLGGGNAE